MRQCVFCRIVLGELPAEIVYEGDNVMAFHDRYPQASTHVLVVPKEHYRNIMELPEDGRLLEELLRAVKEVARATGIERGFRTVVNCGSRGGQTVEHLHFHLLGGRFMRRLPG